MTLMLLEVCNTLAHQSGQASAQREVSHGPNAVTFAWFGALQTYFDRGTDGHQLGEEIDHIIRHSDTSV